MERDESRSFPYLGDTFYDSVVDLQRSLSLTHDIGVVYRELRAGLAVSVETNIALT